MKKKILSLFLSLALLAGLMTPVLAEEEEAPAVYTVTVNYIYESNDTMVAQPYSAAVSAGDAFEKVVAVPQVLNYDVTAKSVEDLPAGVTLQNDGKDGQTLHFALSCVTADVAVNLYYQAGEATYTVKHWQQNLNDDEYTCVQTVELTGSIDAYTQAVENLYDGFTCTGVTQSIISADNTAEVNIYYDRNYYMVTFDPNGGIGGPEPIYARFGTQYDSGAIARPIRAGYNFVSWDEAPSGTVSGNVTYTAQWEVASPTANLSVVLWGENANNTGYSYLNTVVVPVPVGATLGWAVASDLPLCGQEEHSHEAGCYDLRRLVTGPDEDLYAYDHTDDGTNTVTVAPDGTTVLNVYFNRKTFTLHFRDAGSDEDNYGAITAKWGANIESQFQAACTRAEGNFWSEKQNASDPWINHIEIMPAENKKYYCHDPKKQGKASTMTYYGEVLPGGTGISGPNGVRYQVIYTITLRGTYYVTDEDRYPFEGFTCNKNISTKNDSYCAGAKFYYTRNTYDLVFHNGASIDKTEHPKYQQSLGGYAYEPDTPPTTVESDAQFVGWYLNPECTGEEFDLAGHTMPANNIALYAKWVNRSYTVSTYQSETLETPYTYEGYTGSQSVVKYATATAPVDPAFEPGKVFVGWFYRDNDEEKAFSFTMAIVRDYDLYPKWSEKVNVNYTVHYYQNGTTVPVADDKTGTALIGSTITERAKVGEELNLAAGQSYFPTVTSTSLRLTGADMEIIFYYQAATELPYTVRYEDEEGHTLVDPVTKTTSLATVVEQYVPVSGWTPVEFRKTLELSANTEQNVLIFLYRRAAFDLTIRKTGATDQSESFLFDIVGADGSMRTVAIQGNGTITVQGLQEQTYTVTERPSWSWRYQALPAQTASASERELTFQNVKTDTHWLSGCAGAVNNFAPTTPNPEKEA